VSRGATAAQQICGAVAVAGRAPAVDGLCHSHAHAERAEDIGHDLDRPQRQECDPPHHRKA